MAVAEPERREGVGWVMGTALVVGLTLALTLTVFGLGALGSKAMGGTETEVDGEERAAEWLLDKLPWELRLAEAGRRPGGETVLRFEVAELSPPAAEAASAGDDTPHPIEVLLVEFSDRDSVEELFPRLEEESSRRRRRRRRGGTDEETQEVSQRLDAWKLDPDEAWHATVERAELRWGDWSADFAVERSFQEGGGWSDLARVNLAEAERQLVLFARYAMNVEATKPHLAQLARCVKLLSED